MNYQQLLIRQTHIVLPSKGYSKCLTVDWLVFNGPVHTLIFLNLRGGERRVG